MPTLSLKPCCQFWGHSVNQITNFDRFLLSITQVYGVPNLILNKSFTIIGRSFPSFASCGNFFHSFASWEIRFLTFIVMSNCGRIYAYNICNRLCYWWTTYYTTFTQTNSRLKPLALLICRLKYSRKYFAILLIICMDWAHKTGTLWLAIRRGNCSKFVWVLASNIMGGGTRMDLI